MLGRLRPLSRGLADRVARPLAEARVSPNLVSTLALPLAAAAGYCVARGWFLGAFLLGLLAGLADLLDGRVADLSGRRTLFGNYYETMVDRTAEILMLAPAVLLHPAAAVAALSFSMLVSYAKPRVGLVIITDNRDWPSLGERADRLALLLGGFLLAGLDLEMGGRSALEVCLWLLAGVTLVGTVQRVAYARRLIEEARREGRVLPYLQTPPPPGRTSGRRRG